MSEILYSIIIPHKNIPDLLKRCINSIPDRNDLEVLIVDDNSSKANRKKLYNVSALRQNIKLFFYDDDRGAGYARNIGLENSLGKWIIFADADDFFNFCFDELLEDLKDNQSDVIYFNANSVDTNSYLPRNRADHLNLYIHNYIHKKGDYESCLRYKFGEPWSKMVKKSLIEKYNIRFDETPIHNDTTFSYLIGFYAKDISVDNRAAYCITVRSGSITKSITEEKELTRIKVFGRAYKFYEAHGIPVKITWHYYQLAQFLFRDKELFLRGKYILNEMGFSDMNIVFGMIIPILKQILHKLLSIFYGKSCCC